MSEFTPKSRIVLVTRMVFLATANDFVELVHRHHKPATGHKLSFGVFASDTMVGVAIMGRPVARNTNDQTHIEVTRCATDGTFNACSALYARCAREARVMGYKVIQTFTLVTEPGSSLKGAGWRCVAWVEGKQWKGKGREREAINTGDKWKWERAL